MGKDNFVWWMGVVESRDDPLNLGRCQVRIFGHHVDNLQEIPTSSLPWALPGYSPNSGWVSSTPIPGDYCFGFFTDGLSSQAPVILAVFPGIPKQGANPQKGFADPRTSAELSAAPVKPDESATNYPRKIDEPKIGRAHV